MTLRDVLLIFRRGPVIEPLNLAYWFMWIDLMDTRNWFIADPAPVRFHEFS